MPKTDFWLTTPLGRAKVHFSITLHTRFLQDRRALLQQLRTQFIEIMEVQSKKISCAEGETSHPGAHRG